MRKIKDFIQSLEDDFIDAKLIEQGRNIHIAILRFLRLSYRFFVPHSHNNHRARLLHNASILGVLWIILLLSFSFRIIYRINPSVLGISYSITVQDVLDLTNQKRSQNGLPPLSLSDELTSAAHQKANDMLVKNYWAHFAPDGTTPWYFIKGTGYNYIYAGENLAKGFVKSSDVVDAWMNSSSHRENMLSDKYADIGFAIVEGNLLGEETVLVIEMFGSSQSQLIASNQEAHTYVFEPTNAPTVQPRIAIESEITLSELQIGGQEIQVNEVKAGRNTFFDESIITKPLFNLMNLSKSITLTILSLFLLTLLIDLVIIERKKIPRIVGHNLDHIMLISFLILYIVVVRGGTIV